MPAQIYLDGMDWHWDTGVPGAAKNTSGGALAYNQFPSRVSLIRAGQVWARNNHGRSW
jgi:hypothetical protein